MIVHDLDNVDRRLVEALAADGRATVTSLAQLVGPDAVGAGVAAFVALNLGPGLADKERIDEALAREAHVLEVHEVAGEDCYLVKLRVGSPQELSAAVARLRMLSPTVMTRTTVVLRTVLERPLLSAGSDG